MFTVNLLIASSLGDIKSIKELLENGADINISNFFGENSIMMSIFFNRIDTMHFLLKNGANINHRDNSGKTVLMISSQRNHIKITEELVKLCDVNAVNDEGRTALMFAISNNNIDIVNILLNSGANQDVKDNAKWTPFIYASYIGNIDICNMLIAKGVDIYAKTVFGVNAFMWATLNNHKNIVDLLLYSYNFNIEDKDIYGRTAVSYAIEGKNFDILKLLLKNNANIDKFCSRIMSSYVVRILRAELAWRRRKHYIMFIQSINNRKDMHKIFHNSDYIRKICSYI
jgi:ankyrin repeat protein